MLRKFNPENMPAPQFYSHGAIASSPSQTLYVSGQVGVGADGSVPADVGEQARLAIANLNTVLAAGGMTNADIAKMTIYLTDEADLPAFGQAAGGALPSPPPAITLLIVKALGAPGLRVEIEAIAVK